MTIVETRTESNAPARPFGELDARTTGTVAVPGDEEYDALVSPWNLAIPVRPAAVVAAKTAQDVVEAVRFAARARPARHAPGHRPRPDGRARRPSCSSPPRASTSVVVHPEGWARVGAGVKWLRVVEAAAPYGLAPAVRLHHRRRHRRLHHRRRARPDGPHLRPRDRPGACDRGRHRRRRAAPGDAHRAPRAVLRPARRQGDAGHRHRHRVRPRAPADVLRRLAVVRRRGRARPSSSGGVHWSDDLPELGTTSIALFQLPTMPDVPPQLADRLTLSVRYVWTGDAEEGERRFAAMRDVGAGHPRRRRAQALHRHRLGAHRPAGPDAGATRRPRCSPTSPRRPSTPCWR